MSSALSPDYDVTAVWTERYYSTLRISAVDAEEARRKARQVWRDETLDFLSNAEFETSRLLRFEVSPVDCPEGRGKTAASSP